MPDMKRREFIALLGGGGLLLAAKVKRARGQQAAMPVVGFLRSASLTDATQLIDAFRQGLKEIGYVEGQNVAIEYRSANNDWRRGCGPRTRKSKTTWPPTLPKIGKYSFSPLLPRCPQRYSEFRCVRIKRSHAPLQSARDYRGLCLLAREGLECTNVLFRPIPPLHRFLCHLCSPCNQTCGPISGAYANKDSSRSRQYGLAAHTEPRVI
jgi:hypothetical protein